MRALLGKLVCWWKEEHDEARVFYDGVTLYAFQCRRCHALWCVSERKYSPSSR